MWQEREHTDLWIKVRTYQAQSIDKRVKGVKNARFSITDGEPKDLSDNYWSDSSHRYKNALKPTLLRATILQDEIEYRVEVAFQDAGRVTEGLRQLEQRFLREETRIKVYLERANAKVRKLEARLEGTTYEWYRFELEEDIQMNKERIQGSQEDLQKNNKRKRQTEEEYLGAVRPNGCLAHFATVQRKYVNGRPREVAADSNITPAEEAVLKPIIKRIIDDLPEELKPPFKEKSWYQEQVKDW